MPRWLSEGISVYEERQHNPSWGESMSPQYREMLLADDLTPISNLSAAFLNPPSPIHLQFAYYESSLVIEYLIEKHGIDAIKKILVDLGDGLPINDALGRNVGSLDKLDIQFAEYARKHAEAFGAKAEWSKEDLPEKPTLEEITQWVNDNPDNYYGRRSIASMLMRAKKFDTAKKHLEHLVELETVTGSAGGVLEMLSVVYRELGAKEAEQKTLKKLVAMSSNALPALIRLCESAKEDDDWESVAQYSEQVLAINPLLPSGQRLMADAAEQLDTPLVAIASLRALAQMDPVDPAGLHYQMATTLTKLNAVNEAKHHVLAALAEAPRYRDAHRLLLTLTGDDSKEDPDGKSAESRTKDARSTETETESAEIEADSIESETVTK